jgi:magnesium-transporting ATPase (P-type)
MAAGPLRVSHGPAGFSDQWIYEKQLGDAFFFAIAVAVGLTPEMLPMIVTVCLSKGAILARVVVRDRF